MIALLLYLAVPATAQEPDSLALQRLQQNKVAGANSLQELSLLLHQALQQTNFDPLAQHIANKQVYDKMLQLGTAPVRETLLLYTPDAMLIDFQKDFNKVIRDGLTLELNWATTRLQGIAADVSSPHNAAIVPVQVQLTVPGGSPVQVHYSAARLDGRYYFFPPLLIPNQDLN